MEFKFDCEEWIGRKPCRFQIEQGLVDCGGCRFYRRSSAQVSFLPRQNYTLEVLKKAKVVGIIRHGGLGNILRTDAVSRGIRVVNPDAHIVWMTHAEGAELLEYVPGVTPINMMSHPVRPDLVRQLDVLINFEAIEVVRPIIEASKCVAGFSLNEFGKFVPASSHALHLQALQIGDELRKNGNKSMQRVLLDAVGLEAVEAEYDLELPLGKLEEAERIVGTRPAIGLNIGTSQKGRLKRWPPGYWVQLVARLNQTLPDARVFVLTGPEDGDIKTEFLRLLKTRGELRVTVLPDTMDVGLFMAVIDQLDYLVTNDTFAFHVASARNTPQVVVAGPMPAQELEIRVGSKLLNTPLSCAPCYYRCTQDLKGRCMHHISVEQVLTNLLKLTEGR
ncbi:glycosyl transferase, family 9 [candidate division TM7 genomosp. GTL1]|nr:glycosyl transferase, family 9 [candidate division TM7 genomosp. GTL1]